MFSKNNLLLIFLGFIILGGCRKGNEYEKKVKPEMTIHSGSALLNQDTIHLTADTVYILATTLTRAAGQVLLIDKGTLIKVRDRFSIKIFPEASIMAEGSPDQPIVFTSAAPAGSAGVISDDGSGNHYWYGIRVFGDPAQPSSSSGIMKYIRVEFAGGDENYSGDPSMLFANVGSGTILNHLQVSYSFATNSFTFRGGTCNASNLFSFASAGNDFGFEEGYQGMLQYLLAIRHPYFPVPIVGPNLAGVFIAGDQTNPVLSNVTVMGPDAQKGTALAYTQRNPDAGLVITAGAKFKIRNSVIAGFPIGGVGVYSRNSAIALQTGESELSHSYIHSTDSNLIFRLPSGVYPPFTSRDFRDFMLESRFQNQAVSRLSDFKYEYLFNYETEVLTPSIGSPLLSGANFDGAFSNPFFNKVNYVGANTSDNWLKGWINLQPLRTNYNY